MKKTLSLLLVLGVIAVIGVVWFNTSKRGGESGNVLDRGRYMVLIGGCNDCHTSGFPQKAGKVDEKDWLTGDTLGWQGPWGTTYAINLRLYMQDLSEEQWMQIVQKMQSRPPMPYYLLQQMTEQDLRAVYHYIRSLGPAGKPAPPYLPPGVDATTAIVRLIPAP